MVTSYVVLQDSLIQKQEQKTKKKKKQENAFVPLDYVISLSLHLYFTFLRKTVGKKIRKFRCSSTLMTTCRKIMNIYYSEVKLLLESFIFLFEPIYKNIYLTITKLQIFENRKILFYTFFFSFVIHWTFVLKFFFKVPITTLICAQNVRNMFSLIFAGLFILKQCSRYMTSTFSGEFLVYSTLEQPRSTFNPKTVGCFFFIPTARHKSHYKCRLD